MDVPTTFRYRFVQRIWHLSRCQAGRKAGSLSTTTSSHWQRKTRLEVLELPSSASVFPLLLARRLPFALYSTFHPSAISRHRRQAWLLCASQGPPFCPLPPPHENPQFWHTDPILTRPISVPPFRTMLKRFLFIRTVFRSEQHHARGVSIPVEQQDADQHQHAIPFPPQEIPFRRDNLLNLTSAIYWICWRLKSNTLCLHLLRCR